MIMVTLIRKTKFPLFNYKSFKIQVPQPVENSDSLDCDVFVAISLAFVKLIDWNLSFKDTVY